MFSLLSSTFCNVQLTEKKSIVYNKPQYKMTKVEALKWASKHKYR